MHAEPTPMPPRPDGDVPAAVAPSASTPHALVDESHRPLGPPPRGARIIGALVLLSMAALAVWIYQRVGSATAIRSQLEAERARQAEARRAETAGKPLQKVVDVVTVRGEPVPWRPVIRMEGTLALAREADIGFMASGRLRSVAVKSGDTVRKGQLLATLDDEQAQAQVRAVEAQIKAVEVQVALARDNQVRTAALVQGGAMPEQAEVQTRGAEQAAQAQLDAARAQLALSQVMLAHHTLIAPFSGVVTRAPTAPGMVVGAGSPLFHVVDTQQLKLTGTVAPEDAALIRAGSVTEVQAQGRILLGKVSAVLPTVDPVTRRVPVDIEVTNDQDTPIYGGSLVRAKVKSTHQVAVLRFPLGVRRPGSQDEVMVVMDGQLEARRVSFAVEDGMLLARGGLSESDEVVVNPSAEARSGDAVSVPKVNP
jgi:RND family efflux transporter MFP subunit